MTFIFIFSLNLNHNKRKETFVTNHSTNTVCLVSINLHFMPMYVVVTRGTILFCPMYIFAIRNDTHDWWKGSTMGNGLNDKFIVICRWEKWMKNGYIDFFFIHFRSNVFFIIFLSFGSDRKIIAGIWKCRDIKVLLEV